MDSRSVLKNGFNNSEGVIFLSGDEIEHTKDVLRMMLKDFNKMARAFDINYSLGGGSALGAIRHGGIIPWDDDIDINISRKDFNKLMQVFDMYKGDKYQLYAPELGEGHGLGCAQIKLKGTVYRSFNELSKKAEDSGVCIDLFVIENTFNNPVLRKLHGYICLGFGYFLTCRKTYQDMRYIKKYVDKSSDAYKMFKKKAIIGSFLRWVSLDKLAKFTVKIYALCKNNNSKYVTVPTGRKHYFGEMYKREILCDTTDAEFDGIKAKVSANSDEYLTQLYGDDYMAIPDSVKIEQHPLMELDFGKY